MPKPNPALARAVKIALVAAVPFLLLAGAVAPEDIGDLLDYLGVLAGLGAGVLHIGRPPSNLKEAAWESVELAEQAILRQDAPEAEAVAEQAAYQGKHAAEDLQLPEAAAKTDAAAQQVVAQAAGILTGAATALVAAIRARRRH